LLRSNDPHHNLGRIGECRLPVLLLVCKVEKMSAMDFTNEVFSLSRLRELDLAYLLDMIGYEPTARKKNDTDYWYLSPLRNDRTASFHVDRSSNEWYDFGLMAGGNPVDFLLRYYRCSIAELLERMNLSFSPHQLYLFEPELHEGSAGTTNKLAVKEVRPLYAYPLKNYLHERSIPIAVADNYCKEVSYEIGGRLYYGIGFQNNMGGWEIRNQNFKQSSAPKDITCLGSGTGSVHVFEGFMDFLSYRALHPYEDPRAVDFVVLNGAGLFDRALSFLEQHETVRLWLDRDVTGKAYTQYALSLGSRYRDESGFYSRHKDLNDWLVHKGEVPKPQLKPAPGLRPAG
jgi:hypothetical protein